MLLTGFDAPMEQVMYLDKGLKEHNLLQAIARVNRVAKNKHSSFIVDYIGIANHLTFALSLYAEEDAYDIEQGLKDVFSEMPVLEERYYRLIHHFKDSEVEDIEDFVTGKMPGPKQEVVTLHKAVTAMKDLKKRADFEVFFKKFLQSLDLILPNPAGHPYRVPAKRFGYILRMIKERYKDDSIDISDAGEKVKSLINEHLIELGIDPKIPPVELLSDDFMDHVHQHSKGNPEAKASEMEHAIRKHCTVHFDEDPAYYKKLSEKMEKLIQQHRDNWDTLAEKLEELRKEAKHGRKETAEGLTKEETVFYEYILQIAYNGSEPPKQEQDKLKELTSKIVNMLKKTIEIIDFWQKTIEVKKLRGNIDTEILLTNIPALIDKHERIAVEIVNLAQKRHEDLLK